MFKTAEKKKKKKPKKNSLSKGRFERKYDRREMLIHAGLCMITKGSVCVTKKL